MHLSGHATKRALFGLATGIDSGCALPSDDGLTLMAAKFSQPGRLSAGYSHLLVENNYNDNYDK
jgi:hypothetical protein